jgi:hypothetical protein
VSRFGPEPANPLLLAVAPAVQEELKLTDEQKTKVGKLAQTSGSRTQAMLRAAAAEGGSDPQALVNAGANLRRQLEPTLGRILDKRQRERLNQIVMQVEGPLTAARPEVVRRLNMTPEQMEGIRLILVNWQQTQREVLEMGRARGAFDAEPNPDEYARVRLGSTRLRRHAAEQITQLLDRKQNQLLVRMLGESFDLGKLTESTANADGARSSTTLPNGSGEAKPDPPNDDPPAKKADATKRRKGRR